MQGFIKPLTGIFALLYAIPMISIALPLIAFGLFIWESVFGVDVKLSLISMGVSKRSAGLLAGAFVIAGFGVGYMLYKYIMGYCKRTTP